VLSLTSGARASRWSERMRPTTAEVRDRFADGPSAGHPAVTRNAWGH
jgi:beta-galactosidase